MKNIFVERQIKEKLLYLINTFPIVALTGCRQCGKSTLLKKIFPDWQYVSLEDLDIREIAQNDPRYFLSLYPEKTIFDEISDEYPSLNNTRIRKVLAAFLFTGDDVFKLIKELSGGERGRVSLAKLMLSHANFLILDEPTNHLDIQSREILEEALQNYTGTVLYVSHDRYFINQTATRILDLTGGGLNSYSGNYDDYIEKKEHPSVDSSGGFKETSSSIADASASTPKSTGKDDYLRQKEEQAKERKRQNQIKKVEKRIQEVESRLSELDELLNDEAIATDVKRLMEINSEHETLDEELLELMMEWEELYS